MAATIPIIQLYIVAQGLGLYVDHILRVLQKPVRSFSFLLTKHRSIVLDCALGRVPWTYTQVGLSHYGPCSSLLRLGIEQYRLRRWYTGWCLVSVQRQLGHRRPLDWIDRKFDDIVCHLFRDSRSKHPFDVLIQICVSDNSETQSLDCLDIDIYVMHS